ncbi:Rap1a/Tai family immunity protein [Nitrobacter winogradskyi]|uniref:Uncharacterized protein n=2 Tax=Nitrobacter winogradskyi TaxID=913 RepID=A0ACC6AH12_NITWI|nr:Rap1a/Tai family immunity protein [Nitrobacter winogradskyi]MCP1999157.1 hypothetical protein [Nitrobacter winogradskyi]GEC14650.1 hypothetical protein NWI01_05420 [Nitrobacter winogradskyi]
MRALIILLFLVFSNSANAQLYSGNMMHEACEGPKRAPILAYIAGVLDQDQVNLGRVAQAQLRVWTGKQDIAAVKAVDSAMTNLTGDIQQYCLPKNASLIQISDVFCKYLKDYPAKRHVGASELVVESLLNVWPCRVRGGAE